MSFFTSPVLSVNTLSGNMNQWRGLEQPEAKMNDKEFQAAIQLALDRDITPGDFIDHFDLSEGTISRWIVGKSLPLPDARPVIIEWINKKVIGSKKE